MAGGLEPELAAVIDVFFPMAVITEAAKEYTRLFPATPLRLYVEALGAAYQPVLDGRCSLGVVGPLSLEHTGLATERLSGIEMVMVAARGHPLAAMGDRIPRAELTKHVQLVLTDRSDLSAGREFGVFSPKTWRLADMFAKHAFLLDGLGWGGMPLHVVAPDLAEGRLVALSIEDLPPGALVLPMAAVYRTATPPGPAGRWLVERLKACASARRSADELDTQRGDA
jgi:DNA-binding transcriptional LysR family regulator